MQAVESKPFVVAENSASTMVADVASEIPPPPCDFNNDEQRAWNHITMSLNEYELIHLTDALTISIITKTYVSWVSAEKQLAAYAKKNKGSIMATTPNGYSQPHQLYHVACRYKKELLQWLPEAALTIPSFQKIMGERVIPQQRSFFDDPIERHRGNKTKIGLVAIDGGNK